MTEVQIADFFARYAGAFSDRDAEAIAALWDFPALMSSAGRQTVVVDRAQFRESLSGLLGFYASQGIARAAAEIAGIDMLTDTTASVRVDYLLDDGTGREVASWRHVYILSDTSEGPRICVSLPDAELRMWQDRGALPAG